MKKKVIAILLSAVTALSMIGCGGGSDAPAAGGDGAESLGGSVEGELSIAIWDEGQRPGLQKIVDEWSEQSGVKATIQVVDWNNYWTLLEAGATGGELPDVFWMHSNVAQKYMENDLLLDLTDKIAESDKIDMSNYYEGIVNLYQSNGKQYAIPKDIDTIALWYNKTIFDEMGVAYPDDTWTWDDFADAAAKLTNDEHWGFALAPGNNQEGYYNTIYSMGGYVISDDKKTSGMDDPNSIKGVKLFTDMIAAGSCPDLATVSETDPNELLCAGKTAMAINGSWMLAGYRDNEYAAANCDIAVLPYTNTPDDRVSIYNGLGWAASANGKNTDAAWSLIEYLGSKEGQTKQAENGVTMSAYIGTSDAWVNSVDCFNLQAYMDMLDAKLVFRPYSRDTTVWEDMMIEKLQDAWTGATPVEDVCKEIAEEMNAALAEE
ncbi:MAG: sugar ABC transporter substrate-binding protein [Pseudobutyrivibrio sp.]|uniref:Sugar ABC transporter substrate-binding protein n=1 Tax=Pseudobutyrivibrio ruminis TaxID=46206 RepID=A0A2G3DXP3_9FIRM|nr:MULTISPECIES: sugar ABC transporter substrate-binding protein [Pseudobutyrivibrio]MBE5904554.1 sugar ABC transporter substrate-binding protein [Pseudobutyrivibrio sp.]PHU35779.1 sugar ABC transporter substrate-binding protein [Pseudobutyrivibrio ruminis]